MDCLDWVKRDVIKLVLERGPMSVGDIARRLGLSYNSARWHVGQLVKKGLLRTVEVDGRRLVTLAGGTSSVRDALLRFKVALIGRGISLDDNLHTALFKLGDDPIGELLKGLLSIMVEIQGDGGRLKARGHRSQDKDLKGISPPWRWRSCLDSF